MQCSYKPAFLPVVTPHGGISSQNVFLPTQFVPPPTTNVLKLDQILQFQHKNDKSIKFLCALWAFFHHFAPPPHFLGGGGKVAEVW